MEDKQTDVRLKKLHKEILDKLKELLQIGIKTGLFLALSKGQRKPTEPEPRKMIGQIDEDRTETSEDE